MPSYEYHCPTCMGAFTAPRMLSGAVRCSLCGSLKAVFARAINKNPRPASEPPQLPYRRPPPTGEDTVGRLVCLTCASSFRWNFTRRGDEPVCQTCRSRNVAEASPKVKMVAIVNGNLPKPRRPLSKASVKRLRFIRNQWRMRCELDEALKHAENLVRRLGFESEKIDGCREKIAELLVEVDRKQQELLLEHERLIGG